MYQFEYVLSREEFVDFNMYCAHKSSVFKKIVNTARVLIISIFTISPFLNTVKSSYLRIGFMWILGIFLAFYVPIYIKKGMPKLILKFADTGRTGYLFENRKLTITQERILEEYEDGGTYKRWEAIINFEETKINAYLFINNVEAFIIPKRVFDGVDKLNEFREYCKSRINQDMS